ncbi:hypothetical protein Godav_013657, partial [Gossypium davidsonii]|nr:hypothetical protein [Gossypium davidsonii]
LWESEVLFLSNEELALRIRTPPTFDRFSRTLSMGKALSELKFEIQHQVSSSKAAEKGLKEKVKVFSGVSRALNYGVINMKCKFTGSQRSLFDLKDHDSHRQLRILVGVDLPLASPVVPTVLG